MNTNQMNFNHYFIYVLLSGALLFAGCDRDPNTYARISTDHGDMIVQLYESTPEHRDNFIKLANEGFYDSLLFHRVIQGFMIQGGDPESRTAQRGEPLGGGGPGYTLEEEIGERHYYGALAAARQGDQVNPEKHSSGSQFYIVQGETLDRVSLQSYAERKGIEYTEEEIQEYVEHGGTPALDGDYTVFGRVIEGRDVIDKIASVRTGRANRPLEDVRMTIEILDRKP